MSNGTVGAEPPAQRVTVDDVRRVRFGKPAFGRRGYDEGEVDDFLRQVLDTLAGPPESGPISADQVHDVAFRKPRIGSRGYDEDEVDAFLDVIEAELRWRASPEGRHETVHPAPSPASRQIAQVVRSVAIVVLVDRGRVLVTELPDPSSGRAIYRPPGAEILFGERGHETVLRSFREEFGASLTDIRPLATLENLYRFNGYDGHELVLVYDAAPADPSVWAQQRLIGRGPGGATTAVWVPIDLFRRNEATLLPDGLLPLLESLAGA